MPAVRRVKSKRRAVRIVYLFTDLEGVAGVDDWDPRGAPYAGTAQFVHERSEMERLLTGEVNACIAGCVDAGVEQVIVNDGHGPGRTIRVEDLHPKAALIRGKDRPTWMYALERCDALFQVGMHAMSDTPGGTLCHTMSGAVKDYRVNGRRVGEFGLSILLAGAQGIPAPFFSGEVRACAQARRIVPGLVTVETKEGMSVLSALHRAPVAVRAEIRERAALAVEAARAGKVQPVLWPGPYKLEIQMRAESYKPEQAGPGKRFINRHTMAWHARDFLEVFEFATYGRVPKEYAHANGRGRKG